MLTKCFSDVHNHDNAPSMRPWRRDFILQVVLNKGSIIDPSHTLHQVNLFGLIIKVVLK